MTNPEQNLTTQYKAGMRRLAAGVSLITTGQGDTRAGLIATAVNSVTAEPPTLLICVNQNASAHGIIDVCGNFCVNILPSAYIDIADQFSSSAKRLERFAKGTWQTLQSGAPVLVGALASFDCRVSDRIAYHSHTIFFGEILDVQMADAEMEPLIYLNRHFHGGVSPTLLNPT
ncbi:flavin reductase family protein [Ochrobactrum soli]|uniref:Flavin reductase n=1 Tax=Ochrobactrum soli TaxID=2448455 RepID=A0A849KYS8_9HYPH|nr:flavin reductase family protein [[Ochrobactrum] soli]NNU63236.1 flavin reductase [[Ochrobactrum] soli]